ncbi:MAG: 50S ribosomal protein L13 [Candidatus Shapirobacteria bacterium]|jgi:large subunit ribosomal protein L13
MTHYQTPITKEFQKRQWHLIDVAGLTLGRISTKIAGLLIGKGLPGFSYHQDSGDFVVVINTDKIRVTGDKLNSKIYNSYSGFPGGLKSLSLKQLMAKDSTLVIKNAVAGMIPKNRLRHLRMARLKIFASSQHPFTSNFISQDKK